MNQARLPSSLYDTSSLADAPYGSKRWMTPWSMQVDTDGLCWIDVSAPAHRSPGGTVSLLVARTSEGFIVVLPKREDYRWTPVEKLGEDVMGAKNYAPVAQILCMPPEEQS